MSQSSELQPSTEETPVNVHALTVLVCQDCIDLKGVMCNNAECVFCRRTMVEVQQLLDAMLLCPIVDGKRLILVGDAVTNEDTHLSPASTAPVVKERTRGAAQEIAQQVRDILGIAYPEIQWPLGTIKGIAFDVIRKYFPAAATAAYQVEPVSRDLLSAFKELIKWHHMAAKHGGSADECEWAVCVGYKQIAEDCDAAPVEQSEHIEAIDCYAPYRTSASTSARAAAEEIDKSTMDWALRELADGWIQNNEREGPHGFYQNARRVLNAIVNRT